MRALNKEHAIMAVKSGERQTPPIAREEGYEREMVFEGFLANQELWEAEGISVEDKLSGPPSEQELAREAVSIQDAVNFYALCRRFSDVVKALYDNKVPIQQIEKHPVVMAWLSKITSLVGDSHHDVWKSEDIYDMADPTVERNLDRAVREHKASP